MEILTVSRQIKAEVPDGLIKLGAGILRLVLEYDTQVAQGRAVGDAIEAIRAPALRHDGKLVEQLELLVGALVGTQELSEIVVGDVIPGMVFMVDLVPRWGPCWFRRVSRSPRHSWSACATLARAYCRKRCA